MTGEPYSLKLKPNTEAAYTRHFPVPQKHLDLMKDEVNHLIELGVLGQTNDRIASTLIQESSKRTTPFVLFQTLQVSTNMM